MTRVCVELPLRLDSVANLRHKSANRRWKDRKRGVADVPWLAGTPWSDSEIEALRSAYGNQDEPVSLAKLAGTLGRDKANVCRKARSLGLTNQNRKKTLLHKPPLVPLFANSAARNAATSKRFKKLWAVREHPRGYAGHKHSSEALAKMSARIRESWRDPNSGHNSEASRQRRSDNMLKRIAQGGSGMRSGYSRCRGGKRSDLGDRYFRSAWEANYARFLNFLQARGDILGWEYEPKTFEFHAIRRGTRMYTPDFHVTFPDGRCEWHEVKGWMDAASKTRLARMARYYPDEKIIVIGASWFKDAKRKIARMIPNWETGTIHV